MLLDWVRCCRNVYFSIFHSYLVSTSPGKVKELLPKAEREIEEGYRIITSLLPSSSIREGIQIAKKY